MEDAAKIHFKEFKAISRSILAYTDLKLLINHIAERICSTLKVKGCSVMLYDEREGQLFRVASCGISETYLDKGPIFIDDKYCAFSARAPVFIEDFQNDPRVQYPEDARKEGITSMLSVPIHYRKSPVGLIRIYHDSVWRPNDDDLDSFALLADYLGVVIENNGLRNFLEKVKYAMESLPLRMLEGL
ncbi:MULTISPECIES: GAF domain-containing protein [Desulfococcus]|jgi:signal transduction protein with GAF and PtsI domain|uniref:Putative GAF sensor protein n=1 Tax=Desulfococcus multivorans DSM 2059 TaxID=1121405 RepID=S7TME3_DESML|nr:GAF domain-containing protein [Desulfococcus multivorans]AOY59626.1 putative GAF sensor protein [Desulfococcus multivorans]AQV01816.1 GAF domain-containing protein [Desulfococcus multivorans]EPR37885.1 putative GAF sensor protein [Desulfococcus multivorans DSM 2059]MDX9817515.1 GAF domain-containing protein [Desulfococcus multivorans]SKA16164.1 GAF domain-containing protein [Desulfococcus multivorans DSM 2059]